MRAQAWRPRTVNLHHGRGPPSPAALGYPTAYCSSNVIFHGSAKSLPITWRTRSLNSVAVRQESQASCSNTRIRAKRRGTLLIQLVQTRSRITSHQCIGSGQLRLPSVARIRLSSKGSDPSSTATMLPLMRGSMWLEISHDLQNRFGNSVNDIRVSPSFASMPMAHSSPTHKTSIFWAPSQEKACPCE